MTLQFRRPESGVSSAERLAPGEVVYQLPWGAQR